MLLHKLIARLKKKCFTKVQKQQLNLISVRPKNYRRIALYTIEKCKDPLVWMNKKQVNDFSEHGPLVQKQIRVCIDFLIKDGNEEVLAFHDHPDEMYFTEKYKEIAEHCRKEGWLKINTKQETRY